MKFSLSSDTLAFQLSRPGVALRNMTSIETPHVAKQCAVFKGCADISQFVGTASALGAPCGDPEHDAITFYMLNHAMAIVRQRVHMYEPLGKYFPIAEAYGQHLAVLSLRMFYYMLLICTRESRHVHSLSELNHLGVKYGQWCLDFNASIKSLGSTQAAEKFMAHPPKGSLGAYTSYLTDNFNEGSYSGGYGGKAWGKVAEVLRDFVLGKLSAEMMMDTSFTLCHNNGPIFNKGMLFSSYTNRIYKILDVQRSGQIPQLVAKSDASEFGQRNAELYVQCRDIIGDAFAGYVDWFLVEELGALKTYKAEQQEQVQKYGFPTKYKAKMEAQALKQQLAAAKLAKELASSITIHPGCIVKKLESVRG